MTRGICRLCGEENDLIFSHIFPEFLYKSTYDESHRFISVTSDPRHKPRPMQKGLREHLLCALCERQLSRYEAYSAGLLRRGDAAVGSVPRGAVIKDVDFTSFRLFGLSLLWRSHVARSHTFGQVDLGPHAERLRTMLHMGQPGAPHEYGFALAKVTGLDTHGYMIIGPVKSRYRGHRAYHFMAGGYEWVFVVSSDSRGLHERFPFVGTHKVLYIPTIRHDQRALFAKLRHAFPEALATKR